MSHLKFSELVSRFLAWAAKCRKPSTVAVYRHYLQKFTSVYPELMAKDISFAIVSQEAKTWHDVQAIKRVYSWGHDEARILESNPVAKMKHPPKGERRRICTRIELAAMLRTSRPDCRELLVGYRETMARPQELRAARWEDLHAVDPTVKIRDALQLGACAIVLYEYKNRVNRRDPGAPRVILLSPRVCRLLLRLFDRSVTGCGPIFLTGRGRAWTANALRCRFRRLRVQLHIERDQRGETIVPYTLRHTGATIAAAKGVRDRILADVLGHVETKTTARYQHLQKHHLIEAMGAVWKVKPREVKN